MKPLKLLAGAAVVALASPFGIAQAAQPTAANRFETAPTGQIDSKLVPSSQRTDAVRVIVEVTGDPVAVVQAKSDKELTGRDKAAIRSQLKGKQKPVKDKAKVLGGKVLAEMQDAYNGVKVEVAGNKLAELAKAPGVKAVHAVEIHTRSNATSGAYLGVPGVWEATGLTGEGVKVAIIDTGVDYTHADFGGPGTVEAYAAADATDTVAADPALFGPDAPRVKGGYDFVGDDYDASAAAGSPLLIPKPDPNPLDCQGHGSHVAGTAAGGGVTADGEAYTGPYDESAEGTVWKIGPGIAPEADIYAYRVFGCDGSTDVTVEAIDRAVADGVDVINMSLGSSYGTADDPSAVASTNAVGAGVVVIASAGNAGPNPYVTGSPGVGKGVVSVAANDGTASFPGAEIHLPDGTAIPAIVANGIDPVPAGPFTVVHLKDIDGTPENESLGCSLNAYTANGVTAGANQLAVSVRGTCARVARAVYAQQAGAAAAAMIDSSRNFPPYEGPITSNPDNNEAYEVTIPFLGVRGVLGPDPTADGDKLVAAHGQSVTLSKKDLPNPAFTNFASFSSGGPRTGDSGLKPSVTAPGVSIMSAEVGTGSGGYFNSGTSMAAPQVAGVAALNVQAHPGWSAEAISANLVNTADPSKVGNYRLTLGGAGLVDVAQSVDNTVTAVSDPFETPSGSLQEPSIGFGFVESTTSFTGKKKITLTNHGTSAKTYAVAAQPTPQTVPATVKFSPRSVTVPAGGSATVDVTLTVDMTKVGSALAPGHAFYEASGNVVFSGDSELRVPYLAVPRAMAKVDAKLKGNLNSKAIANKNSPMKVDVEVTNRGGAIDTAADFYTLGLTDAQGDVPVTGHGTDLRAVGVQSFADGDDQLLVFAVNTWDRYSNAARNETGVDIDVDNDGTTDWTVFSVDSGLVRSGSVNGVNEVFLAEAGGGLYAAGFYASSPTDNSTVLLPVYAADLGITAEKGTFAYTGYVSSIADSAANDAFEGTALYNPWKPALSNGQWVDVAKGNAKKQATVAIDRAEFAAQKPGGVMVVAYDNKAGADEAILLLAK